MVSTTTTCAVYYTWYNTNKIIGKKYLDSKKAATISQSTKLSWHNTVPELPNMSMTYSWHVFQQVHKDDGCCRCIGLHAAANYADIRDCQYIQSMSYSTHHSKIAVLLQRAIQCLSGKECTLSTHSIKMTTEWRKQWMDIVQSLITACILITIFQANWVGHFCIMIVLLSVMYVYVSVQSFDTTPSSPPLSSSIYCYCL